VIHRSLQLKELYKITEPKGTKSGGQFPSTRRERPSRACSFVLRERRAGEIPMKCLLEGFPAPKVLVG